MTPVVRSAIGEFLGTGLLLFIVVGSGIAAESLSDDLLVQLGLHAVAVGMSLVVLISLLAPLSGAHFNPAVTMGFRSLRLIDSATSGVYVAAQVAGGVAGVMLANAMFGLPWIEVSDHVRSGTGQLVSEFVGTFVLVLLILGLVRSAKQGSIPLVVGTWVSAIIVATPSFGFANPAVTAARTLTDTFTGIAPSSVLPFVAAQALAGLAAALVARSLYPTMTEGESV